jgi:16S rRNA (cytidine1402-2'-O)-methyltransferase
MEIHGIALNDRPVLSYHDHNGDKMRPRLLGLLAEGKSLAYGSEAGTPMVADPGFALARAARAEGHTVVSAPGPSAVLTALTVGGLPTDRFFFNGFLPNSSGQRKSALTALKDVPGTLVFYESPKRIAKMLRDAAEVLGPEREAAVCRELTKKFEEVIRAPLAELAQECDARTLKGEIVVLIDRAHSSSVSEEELTSLVKKALQDGSVRDAADQVAKQTGLPRRKVYQLALRLERNE